MKLKLENLIYQTIYPGAKPQIFIKFTEKTENCIDPIDIREIIKYLLLISTSPPRWMNVKHRSLIKKVVMLIFDGIDRKKLDQYKDSFTVLQKLTNGDMPINVISRTNNGNMIPAIQTFLGYGQTKYIPKKFKSLEEMKLTEAQLIDNGYPYHIPEGYNITKLRCHYFGDKSLTEEELASYKELPSEDSLNTQKIIAIDCEMIETTEGEELARLSATDENGKMILDQLFRPKGGIKDLRYQYSGITEEMIKSTDIPTTEAVNILSQIASANTIIVGHSLENDLKIMKLLHKNCIDTAVVYNADSRPPSKPPLANLYAKYIKKPFRTGATHDPAEDAMAAMVLAKYALQNPVATEPEPPSIPEFLTELKKYNDVAIIDRAKHARYAGLDENVIVEAAENDNDALEKLSQVPKKCQYISVHMSAAVEATNEDEERAAIIRYNEILQDQMEKLEDGTALLVYLPNGAFNRFKTTVRFAPPPQYDYTRASEFEECRNGLLWIHCIGQEIEM